MPPLFALRPGTRFRLIEMEEVSGTLIKVSESRAVVRLDLPDQEVEFTDSGTGELRAFKARNARTTSWAATTLVRPVGFETLDHKEHDMSKSAKKTASPKASKETKRKTPKAKAADGKLSCIDAAAKVLAEAKEPMTTKAMIEAMAAKKLWTSPGGKTPAATLFSAILREISTKGKQARFKKADRGLFIVNG
jgi:hypothetical protein